MTYRDDTESLHAQVEDLERRLAEADQEIARLKGLAPVGAAQAAHGNVDRWVGEPLTYEDTVELPYRVGERGYEAIAALLTERLGTSIAQVGSTLRGGAFSLTTEGESTRITLRTDLRPLRASVLAGGSMAALFGGLPLVGVLMDVTHSAAMVGLHSLWALPALAIAGGAATRRVAARRAREGRAKHQGTLAAVVALAEQHRGSGGTAARVRVAEEVAERGSWAAAEGALDIVTVGAHEGSSAASPPTARESDR
ncbi:MAG: hypothetical protein H6726_09580 [Sandaracinaceae bacterium]|nr:hypothetical protein [Sandaracinaceae bacterium]